MFTNKQKKKYLDAKGSICLYNCQSVDLNTLEIEYAEDGIALQEVKCGGCGRVWKDMYKLIDVLDPKKTK